MLLPGELTVQCRRCSKVWTKILQVPPGETPPKPGCPDCGHLSADLVTQERPAAGNQHPHLTDRRGRFRDN